MAFTQDQIESIAKLAPNPVVDERFGIHSINHELAQIEQLEDGTYKVWIITNGTDPERDFYQFVFQDFGQAKDCYLYLLNLNRGLMAGIAEYEAFKVQG